MRCVDLAVAVGAPVVSVWSGSAPEGLEAARGVERLVEGLTRLCAHAKGAGVRIGFEPEPHMAIETLAGWEIVRDAVASPVLGLTLDIGHCLATREGNPAELLVRHAREIVVLQVDDHRAGVHDHLMFGEGEIDWPSVARGVRDAGYVGPIEVELSRHSSEAPSTARRSIEFLRRVFD